MGYISDRVTAVSLASGLAAMVYLPIYLAEGRSAPRVFALLAVMGMAEAARRWWANVQLPTGVAPP